MITNATITYYKKRLDNNKLPVWDRIVYRNVWKFGGKGSSINKGYENANDVDVRIPLEGLPDTSTFKIGDIIAVGIQNEITKQSDLDSIEYYNVTSVNVNDFGNSPHIHLGGK